jgi:DegV family protein with EDD domain
MTESAPSATVRIVTDSACDLPASTTAAHRITIVPLTIRFGDEEFTDGVELTAAEFWARCASSADLPATAAPGPGQFEAVYRTLAAQGAPAVVVVSLSAALSATMQSAQVAAEAVADTIPVFVVDSRSVSMGLGMMVLAAAELAERGASAQEIVRHVEDLRSRTKVWGALDTLDNLKKGGRIGGAKAFLASALAIKPIIEVRDGVVEQGGKQRTRAKALAFLVDKVREHATLERLAVLHADCSDVDAFVDMLRPYAPGEIVTGEIGAVIGTHAGRGTIGVAFITPSATGGHAAPLA